MDYDYEPDLDEMSEVESDPVTEYPILFELDLVPAALITSFFEKDSPGADIVNAPWQVVFLTDDNEEFCSRFQTESREYRNLSSNDGERLDEVYPSRQHLPVIRCIKTDSEYEDSIKDCLTPLLKSILLKGGVIFVNNVPGFYYDILRDIVRKHKKESVYILGGADATETNLKAVNYLIDHGFAKRLPDNCNEFWEAYARSKEYDVGEHCERIQISLDEKNRRTVSIPKRTLSLIKSFGTILTFDNAEGNEPEIPRGEVSTDFRRFLEYSVDLFPPIWYCYNPDSKFCYHLKRVKEDEILAKLEKAMYYADHLKDEEAEYQAKPLLLTGQTYSGKTNILCSIAWQMYKRKHPVIYIPSKINSMDSNTIETLTMFLRELEDLERNNSEESIIVPTLIVWDISCHRKEDLDRPLGLLKALRDDGRQVQMICSSFGFEDDCNDKSSLANEISLYQTKNYNVIHIEEKLTDQEQNNLFRLLQEKGGFYEIEIKTVFHYFKNNPHFIATLFMFGEIYNVIKRCQTEIRTHLNNELEASNDFFEKAVEKTVEDILQRRSFFNLSDLLEDERIKKMIQGTIPDSDQMESEKRNELRKQLEKMLYCLAFCTRYDCPMPISLVIKILSSDSINSRDIYGTFLNHALLRGETVDSEDDMLLKVRSPIEARIILKRHSNDFVFPLDLLLYLLDLLDLSCASNQEIKFFLKLIQSIGPNSKIINRYDGLLLAPRKNLPEIWNKLKQLRKKAKGCKPVIANKLLPQELSLIREYYKTTEKDEDNFKILKEAQDYAEDVLGLIKNKSNSLEVNVLVEYCHLSLVLIRKEKDALEKKRKLIELFNNCNRLYILWMETLSPLVLPAVLAIGDEFLSSADIDKDTKREGFPEWYRYCTSIETNDDDLKREVENIEEYFDSLSDEKDDSSSSNVLTRFNVLRDRINIKKIIKHYPYDDDKKSIYAKKEYCKLMEQYKKNSKYDDLISNNPFYAARHIELLWASYTGKGIVPENKEKMQLSISEKQWKEIWERCYRYEGLIANIDTYKDASIFFLYAVCEFHLKNYQNGMRLLKSLSMVRAKRGHSYFICDEEGHPKIFQGEFDSVIDGKHYLRNVRCMTDGDSKRQLYHVLINPNHFNLPTTRCSAGTGSPQFFIAVSFSGTEAVPVRPVSERR